ncbi:hypothetical protein ACFQWH_23310 [Mycolicibacterium sp. GCM10028919]|uniref:MmyB family transcriptional regulator n=1 Tax=Mycolicibacterium sp. GCM10028919 TaxID=3273401 RepID=UPI0036151E77
MVHVTAIRLQACEMSQSTRSIRNGRHDLLAMNHLGRARYSPVQADPRRPANTARFAYMPPQRRRVVLRRPRSLGSVAHTTL